MDTLRNLLLNLGGVLNCARELLKYACIFLRGMVGRRTALVARLLAVESQLAVCTHRIEQKKDPRPRFTAGFRLLWVVLSKFLDKWEDFGQPDALYDRQPYDCVSFRLTTPRQKIGVIDLGLSGDPYNLCFIDAVIFHS